MALTKQQKQQIERFNFRYAKLIEWNIYKISPAKESFDRPTKPLLVDNERVCFWDESCIDNPICIKTRDILLR